MTPEKWENTISNIKDNFKVEQFGKTTLDEEGGIVIEYIEFFGTMGKMRLEYVSKPAILEKKTTYSKRIGSETNIEYVYSADEKSHQLLVYKWNDSDEEWEEMDSKLFDK